MSFGRNPLVARAKSAEEKLGFAKDASSRAQLSREAAHLWERAAEREKDVKKQTEYQRRAEELRADADTAHNHRNEDNPVRDAVATTASRTDPSSLN